MAFAGVEKKLHLLITEACGVSAILRFRIILHDENFNSASSSCSRSSISSRRP